MKRVWVRREIEAPAERVWDILVDTDLWAIWGPTVADVRIGGPLSAGAVGSITTAPRVTLPFRITTFDEGERWSWKVAGVAATDHRVRELADDRCRAEFGVAWPAAPYLLVCRVALARIAALATAEGPA